MVPDSDRAEAAVAILARALGKSRTADRPTVGKQSATVLENEIVKYLGATIAETASDPCPLGPGDG